MAESTVHAPYNFVPFTGKKPFIRYGSPEELPPHDRILPELHSGEIRVTLRAETPVFISDGEKEDPRFFRGPDGRRMIPGSTVRGMLRENLQILGYGLMTPDFHPRAGYAAFAALTELFHGLAFDRAIVSAGTRHLFAFHGAVGGENAVVLAGWDTACTEKADVVRIKTDARRAIVSDIMGNRTDSPFRAGGASPYPSHGDRAAEIVLSPNPTALILFGASRADVEEGVSRSSRTGRLSARSLLDGVTGRQPDFVLDRPAHVHDLYAADQSMAHRIWRGPQDLSARIWVGRDGDELIVRAEVRDDVKSAGDSVEVGIGGGERRALACVLRTNDVAVHEGRFPLPHHEFELDLRVVDDDGDGVDGWLSDVVCFTP